MIDLGLTFSFDEEFLGKVRELSLVENLKLIVVLIDMVLLCVHFIIESFCIQIQVITHDLKPHGRNLDVTDENK